MTNFTGSLRAIILDLEGTLYSNKLLTSRYDSEIRSVLGERRLIPRRSAGQLIQATQEQLTARFTFRPPVATVLESLGIDRATLYEAVERVDPKMYLKPRPRLAAFIHRLASRYSLAILTDTSTCQAKRVIHALGLDSEEFRIILGGDKVKNIKPHSEPFRTIAQFLCADYGDCVSIGDRVYIDLAPAKKLGMKTVLVSREAARAELADVVIRNLTQVEQALCSLYGAQRMEIL